VANRTYQTSAQVLQGQRRAEKERLLRPNQALGLGRCSGYLVKHAMERSDITQLTGNLHLGLDRDETIFKPELRLREDGT